MGIFAAVGATEQTALNQVGAAPNRSVPTVVWAPFSDPLPTGAVATWGEAVAAVQSSSAPETSIYIFNPSQDDVYLPPGEWHLNNTTIVGVSYGWDDYDYSFRPYQYLQYLEADGGYEWPCHIYGCAGLKNIFFRGQGSGTATYTTSAFTMPNVGDTATVTVDNFVNGFVAGVLVIIDNAGAFEIDSVSAETSTLTIRNLGWDGNASPGDPISDEQDVTLDTSVFQCRTYEGTDTTFTLDNCDFRFGNYQAGSFAVYANATLYLRLKNGTAIRWYAFFVVGSAVVQTDGSPCWIGNDTFFGPGYLATFPAPGTYVRENQDVGEWDQYQSFTTYYPDNSSDWGGSTQMSVHEALDRLAAACVAGGHTP
jgi:hypothetical protein